MWRWVLRQVIVALVTIWLTLTITFIMLRLLPGNAITAQLAGSGLPQQTIDARIASAGYDQPLLNQYITYIADLSAGNLGQSLYTGQSVTDVLASRLDDTAPLALYSMLLAIALGIMLGIASSIPTPLRIPARFLTDLSLGIPIYVTATLLLFVIAPYIGGIQRGLLLPVIALGFHTAGAIARVINTKFESIRKAAYIRTAHAKGLSNSTIVTRHMLRLVLLPAIAVIGLQTGILFSGTVITETIFGRPGLGLLLLDTTLQRDYPIVQGIVIYVTVIYVVIIHTSNALITFLDPRLSPQ